MHSYAFTQEHLCFRSGTPFCTLTPLCIKVEGSRTVAYFLLVSFHALCSLKQLGRDKQALLGPAVVRGCSTDSSCRSCDLFFPLLPPLGPFMANCSLSCRKYFEESQVSLTSS